MNNNKIQTDVLIVGGEPVGLAMAVELRYQGIDPHYDERYLKLQDVPKAQPYLALLSDRFLLIPNNRYHQCYVLSILSNDNKAILDKLQEVFSRVCEKRKCKLLEFNGEENHVHLLVDAHPDNNTSQLISSLKSASSRIVRKEFEDYLKQFYWKKEDPSFWTDAYCVISAGGAPLEIVKEYIQSQETPKS